MSSGFISFCIKGVTYIKGFIIGFIFYFILTIIFDFFGVNNIIVKISIIASIILIIYVIAQLQKKNNKS